jgi:serine/threonine-protein kinase
MESLWVRLKERKLVQWALAYLAGAWLLLQVFGELRDNFGWSPLYGRMLIVLLGVGFLAALVLAWYHGEKGHQRVGGVELLMLSALLLIAAGVVWLVGSGSSGAEAETTAHAAAQSSPVVLANAAPDQRSIAVLPFTNTSADPENEYFSDGITEEILNALAQVPGLKVTARTSAFQFKDKAVDVREVAQQLGVAHVLEGSVQRAGNRLRIRAQLISARDGYRLWSQRYDREAQDVFAVQDEISRAIVEALKVELPTADAPLVSAPTRSSEAHDLYLRGRFFLGKRTPQDLRTAAAYFRRSVEVDPSSAPAYAGLADAYIIAGIYGGVGAGLDTDVAAEQAARQALALDPSLSEAHVALASALFQRGNLNGAASEYRRALTLNPNHESAHRYYGYILAAQGRYPEALAEIHTAHELDPLSLVTGRALGATLAEAGHLRESEAQLRRTVELDPNSSVPRAYLALTYSQIGRHEEADAEARQARRLDPENLLVLQLHAIVQARAGRHAEAEAALREYEQRGTALNTFHRGRADILVSLGRHEQAIQALEQGVREQRGTAPVMGLNRLIDPLRSDPRWPALARRLEIEP